MCRSRTSCSVTRALRVLLSCVPARERTTAKASYGEVRPLNRHQRHTQPTIPTPLPCPPPLACSLPTSASPSQSALSLFLSLCPCLPVLLPNKCCTWCCMHGGGSPHLGCHRVCLWEEGGLRAGQGAGWEQCHVFLLSPQFGSPSPTCVSPQPSLVEPCIGCMSCFASPWDNEQISIKGGRGRARKGGGRGTRSCDTSWRLLLLLCPHPPEQPPPIHTPFLSRTHKHTDRPTDRQTDPLPFRSHLCSGAAPSPLASPFAYVICLLISQFSVVPCLFACVPWVQPLVDPF